MQTLVFELLRFHLSLELLQLDFCYKIEYKMCLFMVMNILQIEQYIPFRTH